MCFACFAYLQYPALPGDALVVLWRIAVASVVAQRGVFCCDWLFLVFDARFYISCHGAVQSGRCDG